MKKILPYFICALTLLMASCSDDDQPAVPTQDNIVSTEKFETEIKGNLWESKEEWWEDRDENRVPDAVYDEVLSNLLGYSTNAKIAYLDEYVVEFGGIMPPYWVCSKETYGKDKDYVIHNGRPTDKDVFTCYEDGCIIIRDGTLTIKSQDEKWNGKKIWLVRRHEKVENPDWEYLFTTYETLTPGIDPKILGLY